MHIHLTDNGCLTVMLSDNELNALGLSFDQLEGDCPKTQRLLRSLLRTAETQTGFAPEGALTVEALPVCGGCLLLLTPETRHNLPDGATPAAFFVPDENALLQIAAAWKAPAHRWGESSSLYRAADGFWLILYGGEPFAALWECAVPFAEGNAVTAFVAEHATPWFVGDALPQLHQRLCANATSSMGFSTS